MPWEPTTSPPSAVLPHRLGEKSWWFIPWNQTLHKSGAVQSGTLREVDPCPLTSLLRLREEARAEYLVEKGIWEINPYADHDH